MHCPSKNLEVALSHTNSVVSLNLRDRFTKAQSGKTMNEGLALSVLLGPTLRHIGGLVECKIPRSRTHGFVTVAGSRH
jgi:hypothetical protein